MSVVIQEGRLRLTFPEGWRAVKWDDSSAYRDGIGKLAGPLARHDGEPVDEGTKAVDIVARDLVDAFYFLELKDFRPRRHGEVQYPAPKLSERWQSLPLEIGLKVRDTLAGVLGVSHKRSPDDLADWLAGIETATAIRIAAIVPLELGQIASANPAAELEKRMRPKLHWLTDRAGAVRAFDPFKNGPPPWLSGVQIENLP